MEGAILIWTEVMVQPSGRLEESDVSVGGLHFGLLFLCLLQLVSNLYTVLYQASICCKNSQQLTKSAGLCQNEKGEREIAQIQWLAQIWAIRQGHTAAWCNEAKLQTINVQPSKAIHAQVSFQPFSVSWEHLSMFLAAIKLDVTPFLFFFI